MFLTRYSTRSALHLVTLHTGPLCNLAGRQVYIASLSDVRHPLQAGYEHYELSNYALPGHACAHNLTYWHSRPFYGFGLGAASLLGGQRLSRPRGMSQYRCAH